jgi:hypothetical protein
MVNRVCQGILVAPVHPVKHRTGLLRLLSGALLFYLDKGKMISLVKANPLRSPITGGHA